MRQPTAAATPDYGLANFFGSGRTGITAGVPSVTPPSVMSAEQGNAQLGELRNLVEANGTVLRPAAYDQAVRVQGFQAELRELLNPAGTLDTGGSDAMNGVACDNAGKCVFVGDAGAIFSMDAFDGSTLTARTAAGGYVSAFHDVIWHLASSKFVAVGQTGEVQTSPSPGTTWTQRVTSGGVAGTAAVQRIAQNASGRLTAIAGAGGKTITSTDAVSWAANTPINLGTWEGTSIACDQNSGVWLVSGAPSFAPDRTNTLYRSTDGLAWTLVNVTSVLSANEGIVEVLASPSGGFVAKVIDGGDSTQAILASDDGLTWVRADDITNISAFALAAAKHGYAATPQSGAVLNNIHASSDGYSWRFNLLTNVFKAHSRLQALKTNNTWCWLALGSGGDAGKMTKSAVWGY